MYIALVRYAINALQKTTKRWAKKSATMNEIYALSTVLVVREMLEQVQPVPYTEARRQLESMLQLSIVKFRTTIAGAVGLVDELMREDRGWMREYCSGFSGECAILCAALLRCKASLSGHMTKNFEEKGYLEPDESLITILMARMENINIFLDMLQRIHVGNKEEEMVGNMLGEIYTGVGSTAFNMARTPQQNQYYTFAQEIGRSAARCKNVVRRLAAEGKYVCTTTMDEFDRWLSKKTDAEIRFSKPN